MESKITKTFLRTEETMARYAEKINARAKGVEVRNPFLLWEELMIKDFEHWVIIPNEFPYDAIAKVSHMICPKRNVGFDWRLLTTEEKEELEQLKNGYLKENYDALWENFPMGQTFKSNFHLHLLVLRREEC